VAPDSSCQTSALSGRSIPIVCIRLHQRCSALLRAEDHKIGRAQRHAHRGSACSVVDIGKHVALTSASSCAIVSLGSNALRKRDQSVSGQGPKGPLIQIKRAHGTGA
jgi:hypothetical protein